ncbi:MAG: aminoacyl-tRNA hydrolase [Alicyclobacillus sp.]|nr:aminoacyl-tRNA hydrolase [Alicyclobacillus sp.]
MKLIVGLGNPGLKYHHTRHNVGFDAVDAAAVKLGTTVDKLRFRALVGEERLGGEKILLAKPQTFMNLSGESVREMVSYYREVQPAEDLILIYDDMDFPVGDMRLRTQGSAGGHNGVKSVIAALGSQTFARIRIGIGRPAPEMTVIDHVLSRFSSLDRPRIDEVVDRAAEAALFAVQHGFTLAMNRFNHPAP